MVAAAGQVPGMNGLEPRRRRGRRPKAEIEAEKLGLAQFHAAQQLIAQQQALLQAASAGSGKGRRSATQEFGLREHSSRESSGLKPPPAHQKADRSDAGVEMEGVLDLTGKSNKAGRTQSPSSPVSSSRKDTSVKNEKGSKLNQKVIS